MNFDQSFDRLLGNEGGYVDNPLDPGKATKWGISSRAYPNVNIATLSREAAKVIYLADFWNRGSMDQYDGAISFQVFDAAVNCGMETALRMLQRAAGVADDGHIGPISVAAIKAKSVTDMLMLFISETLEYRAKLSTWATFGKGWARRAAADLRYAAQDS